jgi:cyclic pyranopterin phosphate synthase
MPETEYVWLPRADILTYEEMTRVAGIFSTCGVDRVRITGGEPLLRTDLASLIRMLAGLPAIRDLALTTNGVLLAEQASALAAAGLHRLTVSLDTLRPERFAALTRSDSLGQVMKGIDAGLGAFGTVKIDTVVMRGVNDDELIDLLEFGKQAGAEVRFIEYMDVGGATRWTMDQVVSRSEILEAVSRRCGTVSPIEEESSAPAERFSLPDGTVFGIISSTTAPFCRLCDRSRVTADGVWYLCLYANRGVDLRGPLRSGASDAELAQLLQKVWRERADRGAEERLAADRSGPFIPLRTLRKDAHLEMHTRGG